MRKWTDTHGACSRVHGRAICSLTLLACTCSMTLLVCRHTPVCTHAHARVLCSFTLIARTCSCNALVHVAPMYACTYSCILLVYSVRMHACTCWFTLLARCHTRACTHAHARALCSFTWSALRHAPCVLHQSYASEQCGRPFETHARFHTLIISQQKSGTHERHGRKTLIEQESQNM